MIDFYFDVVSPYSWLAWHELRASMHERRWAIRPVPILFGAVLDAQGGLGPAEIPAKRAYVIRDVMRAAKLSSLPFRFPPVHPFNPLKALRLCSAVVEDEARMTLAGALLDAAWSAGEDVTDDATLAAIVARSGQAGASPGESPPDWLARAGGEEARARLRSNTDAAIALGLFGVPSFVVGGELFWGHDRLHHVNAFVTRSLELDEVAYQEALARPRGSDRKRFAAASPPPAPPRKP